MGTTRLGSTKELQDALYALGKQTENLPVHAMRKAARFGHTAVQRTSTRTRDPFKIRASGSYGQAFVVNNIPEGAILSNAMHYAVFVERGRRKGKPPPLKPIVEWVYQKRIAARPKPLPKPRKPRSKKKPPSKPKPTEGAGDGDNPADQGAGAGRGGPKGAKGSGLSARQRKAARIRRGRERKKKLKAKFKAHQRAVKHAEGIAKAVQWIIAKHGTPGRWVLRRTMPAIGKRAAREIRAAIIQISKNPPRR